MICVRTPRTWGRKLVFLTIRKSTKIFRVGGRSELRRTNLVQKSEC